MVEISTRIFCSKVTRDETMKRSHQLMSHDFSALENEYDHRKCVAFIFIGPSFGFTGHLRRTTTHSTF